MLDRRRVLQALGSSLAFGSLPQLVRAADKPPLVSGLPPGLYDTAVLDALPGKKPLIKLSYRPPNYETPVSYFATPITPNDAFFVRYHLSVIPEINAQSWKIQLGGEGAATPFELTLADLQRGFEQVEVTAVCQCSGNRRGLSDPHVAGVEWGVGAMGNAVWRGVRLKDVLAKAGLRKETVEIVVNGADGPPIAATPDFVKSIPLAKAMDENTIIAHSMNGQPLPHFNGYPARLIVPGWTATYWMKHLTNIDAATKPFDGFWMKSAYRIPSGKFPIVSRFATQQTDANEPITEMVVNSVITAPIEGARLRAGQPVEVRGIAWDGGYGIAQVEISLDRGRSWRPATLGQDLGRFSFRPWLYRFTPQAGKATVLAKATNAAGQTQVEKLIFNPPGYHNNVMRPLSFTVA
jgi:sulfite dehydrogenase